MMYRILTIFFGLLIATAVAAESVNETIDAATDGHVYVENTAGSIEVYGWSNKRVEVTGELGARVKELVLERDGDRVTVKVEVPRGGGRDIGSDIVVRVPEESSIEVSGVSADIDVEDVLGEQSLHTVSGDVSTQTVAADIEAQSISGDVEVQGNRKDTETRANSVSGDITLFGLGGEISAEVVSGDVTVDEGSYNRVTIESVNGDLVFTAELLKGGRLEAASVNGGVDINFAGDVSADFEIDSFNGKIENCFGPEAKRTSKYAPGWELSFTEGGGDGNVTVSTLNGNIHICK